VVAIDLPPFGYTQRVGDPSLVQWMALVEAVTHRLGLRHPLVVGHSLGAAVATGIALHHPSQVSGIVLLDGDALRGGGGRSLLNTLLIDPYVTSIYRLLTGSDYVLRQVLERALGPDRPPVSSTMLREFQRPFQVQGTEQQLRETLPHGIIGLDPADLPRVQVPATVVWGQYDSVDSPSAGRRTAAALHAPFELIAGAGHLSMLVRPAAVAQAIDRATTKR
jgi:pimeloyl-ACP methyl ester carboxylesterase